MKKINIKDLAVKIDLANVINISQESKLIVDTEGNLYVNEDVDKNVGIIYKKDDFKNVYLDLKTLVNHNFNEYKPELIGTQCQLLPLNNWQKVIDLNKNNMLYFDHQSDGVEIFEDAIMEDYGWNASPLEISYREITDFIEENCEGTLIFYDNTVQFNGFALVDDLEDVKKRTKEFIIKKALENIEEGIIDVEDDDVIESLEFFEIKV